MNPQELQGMIVRLLGDGSSYQQMMGQAQTTAQDTARKVEVASKQIEAISTGVTGFAKSALATLGMFGLATSLQAAFNSFSELEKNTMRLNVAIDMTGQSVGKVTEDFKGYVKAVEAQTLLTKGQTYAMLSQATTMGFSSEESQRLTSNAIALGAATGQSAQSMMSVVIALERGNTQMLRRVPALRGLRNEEEMVAKAQQLMAVGLGMASAERETAAGKIELLQRSLKNMSKEVGALVADAITPLVDKVRQAVDWFNQLDPAMRRNAVIAATLLGALTAYGPAMSALAPLFGAVKSAITAVLGVMGLFASWWGLILIPAVIVIAVIVQQLGGVAKTWEMVKDAAFKAWDWIKEKVQEFVTWFRPVWLAVQSFATTAWGMITEAVLQAWEVIKDTWIQAVDFLSDIWKEITGDALPTWDEIRDAIQYVVIYAEFLLGRLPQTFNLAWTAIKYAAVVAAEFIMENAFLILLGPAVGLPMLIYATWDIWKDVFNRMYEFAKAVFMQMIENIKNQFKFMWDFIRSGGDVDWKDLWKDFQGSFELSVRGIKIPKLTGMKEDLLKELKEQGAALGEGFDDFYAQRIAEFAGNLPAEEVAKVNRQAEKLGTGIGDSMKKGLVSSKFDAVLISSAEALGRLAEYKDRLDFGGKKGGGGAGQATLAGSTDADIRARNQEELFKKMEGHLAHIAAKPVVEFDGAALGGT